MSIRFDNKVYEFSWTGMLIFAIFAPLISFGIYYSHDWMWLQGYTSQLTVWSLNLLTGLQNYTVFNEHAVWGPAWYMYIENTAGTGYLPGIQFTTFCTGIQATAIFTGVIIAIPHTKDKPTSKNIWPRKIIAIIANSALFYIVNVARMWLQLYLYHVGYAWDDIHYSISAASSVIAIVAVLLVHKFVPEFIMSIVWTLDRIREIVKGFKDRKQIEHIKTKKEEPKPENPQ